ncbi:hypothetical protein LTR94_031636, partial [Friedmanniomyces endolithicus]
GKSALAIEIARRHDGVVINADSAQVYRDLRILSARPSTDEEAQVPHRLFGHIDGAEACTAPRWAAEAKAEIAAAHGAGKLPVLVGGTGLYFNALTKGLADIPPVPVETRDAVQAEFDAEGETAFRRRLSEIDPAAEAAVFPGDRQRLVRALSVHHASGRALSAWKADTQPLLPPDSYDAIVVEPPRE